MMRSSGLILKLVILFYALILTFCNPNENSTQVFQNSSEIYSSLAKEYDAILLSDLNLEFTNDLLSSLLVRPVVMDTVVIGAFHNYSGYYLKTVIINPVNTKTCALLKCDETIYKNYLDSDLTSFIVAANITKIQTGYLFAECETIDNELLTLNAGREMFISGSCIALYENPEKKDLVLKNLN